jgi:ketosteroid isomerase-like protein
MPEPARLYLSLLDSQFQFLDEEGKVKAKIALGLAAILSICILSSPVRADDKREIEEGYKKLVAAFKARSVDALKAVTTDDFTMKMPGQVLSTEETMKQIRQSFGMMSESPKFTMTIDKIAMKAKSAEVHSTGNMTVDIVDASGAYGKKGAKHSTVYIETSKDIWVKTGKGWKMKVTESLSEKMMLDGKPFNPSAPPRGAGAPK